MNANEIEKLLWTIEPHGNKWRIVQRIGVGIAREYASTITGKVRYFSVAKEAAKFADILNEKGK